jgi:anti-sigma regulatory factor (Ser/Thr protein kinase)
VSLRPGEWRTELPATLEAVEQFCVEFRLWRAGACAGLEPFPAELLIREALTNSVIHGCMEDPSRRIYCVLRARPGRLLIAVQDHGQGFDWRAAWNRQPDLSEPNGRGIEIFRLYATSVRFNPKGNVVLLVKRF